MPDDLELSDTLLAGAAPLVRKMVSALTEQWPVLYPFATVLSVVFAFAIVAILKTIPETVQLWLKTALALAGVTSVYHDFAMEKKASAMESIANAKETAPEVVEQMDPEHAGPKIV